MKGIAEIALLYGHSAAKEVADLAAVDPAGSERIIAAALNTDFLAEKRRCDISVRLANSDLTDDQYKKAVKKFGL